MNTRVLQTSALVMVGFVLGIAAANLPDAIASSDYTNDDISKRKFIVSIDEIQQNFVFGEEFVGTYRREVALSDGTRRVIQLTPMVHKGMDVVELKDSGGHTYMGLGGTTTNGKLMVHVVDIERMRAQLASEGWPSN